MTLWIGKLELASPPLPFDEPPRVWALSILRLRSAGALLSCSPQLNLCDGVRMETGTCGIATTVRSHLDPMPSAAVPRVTLRLPSELLPT